MKTAATLLLITTSVYAQLSISVYTDKENYNYGERIKLFCKVTNKSDTVFEFFAPNFRTCQAEFSFNDFNSWEYGACLPSTELLTFMPYFSKIYEWNIDPYRIGLPNNDYTQKITGRYYFGLKDSAIIYAPQFLGGQLSAGYLEENENKVKDIKDSLNVTLLDSSKFENRISELWQVEGFQIDSLIKHFGGSNILTYLERAASMGYSKISDEAPADYFPIQNGNKWCYEVKELRNPVEPPYEFIVTDTLCMEVLGDTIMPNGIKYFVMSREFGAELGRFIRSNFEGVFYYNDTEAKDFLVFDYFAKPDEYYEIDLDYGARVNLNNKYKDKVFDDSLLVMFYYFDGLVPFDILFAENIGPIFYSISHHEPILFNCIGCLIDGKIYGDTNVVGVKEQFLQPPGKFDLYQNYPNPFNPKTRIKYSIPAGKEYLRSEQWVSLKIFDILGNEVAVLVNEPKLPGIYELEFDASGLASGVYFYRMISGNYSETKKMLLLR